MAYRSQLWWKHYIFPVFGCGGTFYAGHPAYLQGMTWARLPIQTPAGAEQQINVLAPNQDTGRFCVDMSVMGIIQPTSISMHRASDIHSPERGDFHYIRVILTAPEDDEGRSQFQQALENLSLVAASIPDSEPSKAGSSYPLSLISEDGKGICLYHRVWMPRLTYYVLPIESPLIHMLLDSGHNFVPVNESEYQQIRDSEYIIVQNPHRYDADMELAAAKGQVCFVENMRSSSRANELIDAWTGKLVAVSFIISGTGSHDIGGEIKEILTLELEDDDN